MKLKLNAEYFRKSFSWKKCMHFVVVSLIILVLSLSLYFAKWKKEPEIYTSKRIVQDWTFIMGITLLAYSGLIFIFSTGFLFRAFRKNKNQKSNELAYKIEEEKKKPASRERELKLKVLREDLELEQQKMNESTNAKGYNFVLIVVFMLSIIFLITAWILKGIA
ncbi:DUF3899 domain-containing protein [Mycoplasma bovis]|nr:hypothetical protein [Mycoplasmopsis bovis]AEI89825.1 conserved hypothetical protein [Mycoplasmopsis bovis Hubei-1]AFM51492.2 putative transmembrane protein [Mycoplasmopsis bovis HB0801]AKO50345.1 membrane protein [Mycoplasmopsis bovis]AQU85433.1 DUF3899 domain-containing protein [Mycoplasmopsis bovis]ATQ40065.1 DUF3899 domain-containing protein [Mycoplasmopsis bovis]